MEDVFEAQTQASLGVSSEFDLATGPLRVVANHFRNREVPRAAALASAARGHMLSAGCIMDKWFMQLASRALPPQP
jgi:hypothetical protein